MATTTFTFGGMDNVQDPVNVGTPDDSLSLQQKTYTGCVDIVNCDIDNDGAAARREGYSFYSAGVVSSSWGDPDETFCVESGVLHQMDADGAFVALGNSPTMGDTTEFIRVNDIVVFSDNTTIGHIKDQVVTKISKPSENIDLLDLETWVALTYPAGAAADESNFEIDAFKIATFAGRCLEFYNGSLYLAVDNFIFKSKTFNVEHMDIRFNVVAGFDSAVTMIRCVNDGLYVGTAKGVYFLPGGGESQKKVLPVGAFYGSAVRVGLEKTGPGRPADPAVVWATETGIFAGLSGGVCQHLTVERLALTSTSRCAAMLRKWSESWLYILSIDGTGISMNLGNGKYARYTNFDFSGFFERAGKYYGTNSDGVFLLEGETDAGDEIQAPILTPVANFGLAQRTNCRDAYLYVRAAGGMSVGLYVDEKAVAMDLPFVATEVSGTGVRQMRAKLPRGAWGSNWQFKISNVDGARFTAFCLKVSPVVSSRSV